MKVNNFITSAKIIEIDYKQSKKTSESNVEYYKRALEKQMDENIVACEELQKANDIIFDLKSELKSMRSDLVWIRIPRWLKRRE